MNGIYKIIGLTVLAICCTLPSFPQTAGELLTITSDGMDIAKKLPPLSELQQQAIDNSPVFKIFNSDEKIGNYKVREEKREWMNSVGIEGGARYGLFDNLIITEDLGLMESNIQTTEQTRYFIGGFIKIPLSAIFDNSNVSMAREEKEKIRYQKEAGIRELNQLVILRYNNVIKEYQKIVIMSDLLENYRVQNLRAETDFLNGKIDTYEYVRLQDMHSKAKLDLETVKIDFMTAFQMLEETVGCKIKLKN